MMVGIFWRMGFDRALKICDEADHGHFAPPCRTFSRARRCDEHGSVRTLRSDQHPEGWGDAEAEEANKIIVRMVQLILRLLTRNRTFAIENPWESFLWVLKCLAKIMKKPGVELVHLHQCAYGAISPKDTGVLTNAEWMKAVCLKCHQVPWHYHLRGGLVCKAWSYLEEKWVWRTSLAAEYPCGLCVAWSKSLLAWLKSDSGRQWLQSTSYVRKGRWRNVLALGSYAEHLHLKSPPTESAAEVRERENSECIGGLRNVKRAVSKSTSLRTVGRQLRQCVNDWMLDSDIDSLNANIQCGIDSSRLQELRKVASTAFEVEVSEIGLPLELWKKLLSEANDPEKDILPNWIEQGFPLGINSCIDHSGVFPVTQEDTLSVEASRLEGKVLQDFFDEHANYKSFHEAGQKAQAQLDKLYEDGRAELFHSWNQICQRFGQDAQLTRLACIIKPKPGGGEKVRLVVDCRRSGVNGKMHIRERVVLPRVSDVAMSLQKLLDLNSHYPSFHPELMSADFSEAFHTCTLREDERKFVIVKGLSNQDGLPQYYVMRVVVFGLAPEPLLWARLCAAAMRLSQATLKAEEADVNTFVDDPVVVSMADSSRGHACIALRYFAVWRLLGLDIAYHKADRGSKLVWIGFQLELVGPGNRDLRVVLTDQKQQRLSEVFNNILDCKGVIPLHLLQYAVGVLGWVTSAIPAARPWLAMVWAAITKRQDPVRETTRRRKGLIFVKQVVNAIRWLHCLVQGEGAHSLQKVYRWRPWAPVVLIQTDACPWGIGGFLCIGGEFVAHFHDILHEIDYHRFGAQPGDPAFQSEYELLAMLVAVKAFSPWIRGKNEISKVLLRSDNMATVTAALAYKSSSPLMVQLTAELVLELEFLGVGHVLAQHVAGSLNFLADKLSRLGADEVPSQLKYSQLVSAPPRIDSFFRAWPS